MRLFKSDKNRPLSGKQEVLAERIAARIIDRQRRLADYLNDKTRSISGRSWLGLLIGFCLLFGLYCLQLVLSAWI